jgi:hypothetical protein
MTLVAKGRVREPRLLFARRDRSRSSACSAWPVAVAVGAVAFGNHLHDRRLHAAAG